jgi:hypothetical protein
LFFFCLEQAPHVPVTGLLIAVLLHRKCAGKGAGKKPAPAFPRCILETGKPVTSFGLFICPAPPVAKRHALHCLAEDVRGKFPLLLEALSSKRGFLITD